jgi:hypothetical protein
VRVTEALVQVRSRERRVRSVPQPVTFSVKVVRRLTRPFIITLGHSVILD